MEISDAFYTDEYLRGKPPTIPENLFLFYSSQAIARVKGYVCVDMQQTFPCQEEQMAGCMIAEALFKNSDDFGQAKNQTEDGSGSVPLGIRSETVGEYSVTYAGNTEAEREEMLEKTVKKAVKTYLAPAGLLFRGLHPKRPWTNRGRKNVCK